MVKMVMTTKTMKVVMKRRKRKQMVKMMMTDVVVKLQW